jgi:YVTN family beta-propeller protein/cysteine-rich repeat protein
MRTTLATAAVCVFCAAVAQGAPFAYIPNSGDDTVSVIDTATDTVVDTIAIPGPQPQTAAVSADGTRVYVGDFGGFGGKIHVIDATTNTVLTSVSVFSGISHLAISPDGAHVYGAGGASVKVVSTATNALVLPLISDAGTANPLAVAFHPTLPRAYAVGATFQSAMAIDTATRTVVASIGTGSTNVVVHPDGTRAFTLLNCSGCFPPPGVAFFDPVTNLQIPGSVSTTGNQPRVMEIDPSGSPLYVTTHDTTLGALLSVIDTTTDTEITAVPIGTEIWGLKLHPDGTRLYVADRGAGQVHVVDTGTLGVTTSITVGSLPFARGAFIGPIATCGDGETTFPEECDDGNTTDGDCCSSACELETGQSCDDGDACTTNDTCDSSPACVGGPPLDCDDGDLCTEDSCDSLLGCVNDDAPRGGCREPGKSLLLIKDQSDDGKDKLVWKWLKGDAVDAGELGDPAQDTDYALCLHAGTTGTVVARYVVPAGTPEWSQTGSGFKYQEPAGSADGIQKALLKNGTAGKPKALAKGKGSGLTDFDLTTLVEPVVAQLVSSATATSGICWSATYQESNFIKNEAEQFKAKVID